MEQQLRIAAGKMPVPVSECEMVMPKIPKKSIRKPRPVLIVMMLALLLVGCANAYGAYKVSRGTWHLWSSHSWVDVEIRMDQFGLTLPQSFGDYEFGKYSVGSTVPHGVSYLQAALFPGYKSYSVAYKKGDNYGYSVAVGDILDVYWMTYFGFESEDQLDSDQYTEYEIIEYAGYKLHAALYQDDLHLVRWVDAPRQICISVSISGGADPLPLAKSIIDLNNG